VAQHRTTVVGIFILLTVFAIGAFFTARLSVGGSVPLLSDGRVAILPVYGVISSDQPVRRAIAQFKANRSVRAYVVDIRSPGGGVGASQGIYEALRKLREEEDRPLIAWIGSVGASGGYYAALPADSILALPGSITGSIGVIMEFPEASELLQKVGVNIEVVKSGPYKDIGSPGRKFTEADREVLQVVIDDVYDQFVEAIVANRPLQHDEVIALADGRIYTGRQAAETGLIDRVGTLDDAIAMAGAMAGLGEDPQTIRPPRRRRGVLEYLLGQTRLTSWLDRIAPEVGEAPRLLYQWK
jgi:protease-4